MVPWISAEAILHDDRHAVVAAVPMWDRSRLLQLMRAHGFTPRVRRVWHSTSVGRARRWLMEGAVEPWW
jgi:hypothetical protein